MYNLFVCKIIKKIQLEEYKVKKLFKLLSMLVTYFVTLSAFTGLNVANAKDWTP